jgi:hypothetical protein
LLCRVEFAVRSLLEGRGVITRVFRRSKDPELETSESNRYRVEAVYSARSHEALSAAIEDALNTGDRRGWHLAGVTQHAAVVLIYRDTSPK